MNNTVQVDGTSSEFLASMANSLRALPELVAALKGFSGQARQPELSDEERGIMLVLRLKNPTQTNVARAMGLKGHSALRKFPAVLEAIRRWEIMKTVVGGDGSSHDGLDGL